MKPYSTLPITTAKKKLPGFCVLCASVATVQALFKVPDAVVIQRYCNKVQVCLFFNRVANDEMA